MRASDEMQGFVCFDRLQSAERTPLLFFFISRELLSFFLSFQVAIDEIKTNYFPLFFFFYISV
jgi:hypothetical protein